MFAPEELADIRGVADDSLPVTCDLLRMVHVKQPNNSWRDDEQTIATGIKCRKVPTLRTPQELLAIQAQTTHSVTTFLLSATAPPVYADDVLLSGGKRYPVAGVADRSDEIYIRVFVYTDSKPEPV